MFLYADDMMIFLEAEKCFDDSSPHQYTNHLSRSSCSSTHISSFSLSDSSELMSGAERLQDWLKLLPLIPGLPADPSHSVTLSLRPAILFLSSSSSSGLFLSSSSSSVLSCPACPPGLSWKPGRCPGGETVTVLMLLSDSLNSSVQLSELSDWSSL